MLAIADLINARLLPLAELTGWDLRTGTVHKDRTPVPAVDTRFIATDPVDAKGAAVLLRPRYRVTLISSADVGASARVDTAMAAVIQRLHGWMPGETAGRRWEPLALMGVGDYDATDPSITGIVLFFATSALYMGQQ